MTHHLKTFQQGSKECCPQVCCWQDTGKPDAVGYPKTLLCHLDTGNRMPLHFQLLLWCFQEGTPGKKCHPRNTARQSKPYKTYCRD